MSKICPCCERKFASNYSVIRHCITKHGVAKSDHFPPSLRRNTTVKQQDLKVLSSVVGRMISQGGMKSTTTKLPTIRGQSKGGLKSTTCKLPNVIDTKTGKPSKRYVIGTTKLQPPKRYLFDSKTGKPSKRYMIRYIAT